MTFNDMLNDVKARCAFDESVLDSNFKTWLNQAQQNITTRYLWPFLEKEDSVTTTADTEEYSLPSDLRFLIMVRDTTNDVVLDFVSLHDFYRTIPDPSATGTPYAYRLPGNNQSSVSTNSTNRIAFYPIPAGTYTIKVLYYRRLSDLSASTDVSFLPAEFHELLIHYAASIYFSREGDSRTMSHNDRYESGLLDMVSQYGGQPVDRMDVLHSSESHHGIPIVKFPPAFGRANWNH